VDYDGREALSAEQAINDHSLPDVQDDYGDEPVRASVEELLRWVPPEQLDGITRIVLALDPPANLGPGLSAVNFTRGEIFVFPDRLGLEDEPLAPLVAEQVLLQIARFRLHRRDPALALVRTTVERYAERLLQQMRRRRADSLS
jgi:hypothetical protein